MQYPTTYIVIHFLNYGDASVATLRLVLGIRPVFVRRHFPYVESLRASFPARAYINNKITLDISGALGDYRENQVPG